MPRSAKTDTRDRKRGCLVLAVIALALAVSGVLLYQRTVGEAKRTEQTLNETCGEAPSFVPAADGSIAPERVEAFLRVRERVRRHCPSMQDRHVEGLAGIKRLLGFGGAFLRFMEARNQALLDERMGLGEYMYIYVLAYREPLVRAAVSSSGESREGRVGERAREELVRILQNQLDLAEAGADPALPRAQVAALRDQIARLGSGEQHLPWEHGLSAAVEASLEPYGERLSRSYCEGIARTELMQKNKGFDVTN